MSREELKAFTNQWRADLIKVYITKYIDHRIFQTAKEGKTSYTHTIEEITPEYFEWNINPEDIVTALKLRYTGCSVVFIEATGILVAWS